MPTAQSAPEDLKKAVTRKLLESEEFREAYAKLNPQQKQAVDTTEGPVMLVAGPGTGKTQVLALRVANILQSTQMRPSNILCLTFSTSGATAMRQRLRNYIGSDAYGITVNTIHGFCNDIITSHPAVFEDWGSLSQISDVERYREIHRIIDSLMPGLQLVNAKAPYMRTRDILSRISQLKREGVTDADQLESIAQEYDHLMATKSKEGTKVHKRNLESAEKFRDLITVFHRYQQMLRETGRYDYDDMILHVIDALRQEDWMLAGLQERYQYILVDEFQDTNGAQFSLIDLLTTDPTGDNSPNLFVVGDDDQAIYRFQGASLKNILSFTDRFPEAPVIALTTSYRCSQHILDAADTLISHNDERLVGKIDGLDKTLQAATAEEGYTPVLHIAASDMAEPWLVADMVSQRLDEGVAPEEIAILVQTNAELLPVYDVLKARNIPVQLSGKLDLLSHPIAQQTVCIIQAIAQMDNSAALADALCCNCFQCHSADLGKLFRLRRDKGINLHDVLLDVETEETINFVERDAVIKARDTLLSLQQKLGSRTVAQTLEHIFLECHILDDFARGEMDVVDFAAGQEFFDRIVKRAYEQPEFSFHTLISDLEFYGNGNYRELRLSYDLPHLTESGVQLMTAHKSKGLEFHTVMMMNFREGHWDKRRTPASIAMPEDLLFGWEKQQKAYEKNQDERRVAFVAMTRAKRELIFTCPQEVSSGDSAKEVAPSSFFAEAGTLDEIHSEVKDPGSMSTLMQKGEREFDAEFAAFLRHKIENFALSPTALHHFLEDPQMFLELDLLERPQAKEAHFAYGNAVHHVLAKWAQSVKNGEPISQTECIAQVQKHLQERELLTASEYARLADMAKKTIKRYFDTALQPPYPIVEKIEFGIKTHLGDIPIKGKIDRLDLLEPHSSDCRVIDFKTGKPKTPKQIEQYGYHRQLVFYALLLEKGMPIYSPKEFVLDFVGEGTDEGVLRSFSISQQEKMELRCLVEQVWEKILALDFSPI